MIRAVVALAAALAPLPAQDRDREALRANFARLDRNGDGALSRSEFPGSDRQFAAIDADRNRSVSAEEYARSEFARRLLRASEGNSVEPRPRTTVTALQAERLAAMARFDHDRDGRITASEWTGSPAAFAAVDLDGDGVVDARDRYAEARRSGDAEQLPEVSRRLPQVDYLLQRLDRDGDGELTRREADSQLRELFAYGDRDRDDRLTMVELRSLVREVAQAVDARNRGSAKPRAFVVPFSVWDKDDNGRLEQSEWLQRPNLFPRIDQDRDAGVTLDEVERYRRAVEGKSFLERFDLDDDGRVTLDEFGGPPESFRRADRNGDGVVSRRDR